MLGMKKMTKEMERTRKMEIYCRGGMGRKLKITFELGESEEVLRQTYKLVYI